MWTLRHPAPGRLDYGSSPRATPLIHGGRAYLFGAFGHLQCVELATGTVVWEKEVRDEFPPAADPPWGWCGSPLIADGKLIVNVGGDGTTLAAFDPGTGNVLWKGEGDGTGYGSFVVAELGGRRQVVGHDATSLGGWDPATGRRIWTLKPPRPKDFNVPTPIVHDGRLVVTTEHNGTRMYRFRGDGTIDPMPVGEFPRLRPDTHTPVVARGRLFGVAGGRLHCLDLADKLTPLWTGEDKLFADHVNLIASDDRLLAVGTDGEAVLMDPAADRLVPLGRLTLVSDERGVYAHPAVVGSRLYYRGSNSICCVDLRH